MQNIEMGTGEPSQSRLTPCQLPPFVAARHLFLSLSPAVTFLPGAGRLCPGRGKSSSEREPLACLQALRFSRKLYRHVKGPISEGAGIERSEMTGGVLLLPRKKRLPEQTFFVWCIIFYNFPHCLPVKKRRVVVARNTLPARNTVVGNSGWEGLQG